MISRVTVLLPLVPEIETIGMRRSASRIQVGGVARAAAMRSVQRASEALLGAGQVGGPRRRDVALGQGERGLGQGQRPLRAEPREGDDPVPGIRRAVDAPGRRGPRRGRRAAGGSRPTTAATPSGQSRAGTPAPEVDERVAPGIALAVPGPPPPDGDLDLDHRLEPVDVGAFEQAGLDQSHGPGRIASRHAG